MESNKKGQFEVSNHQGEGHALSEDARELAELVEDPEESIEYIMTRMVLYIN